MGVTPFDSYRNALHIELHARLQVQARQGSSSGALL
jgi:hypothetical protein